MEHFPSYVEHRGVYNVDPVDYFEGDIPSDANLDLFFQTVEDPPALLRSELQDIRDAVYQCLLTAAPIAGLSQDELRRYYRYSVGDELKDRTARIELPDIEIVTVGLVEALQREVLASRPLWRIMIVAESPETVIMIYPDTVRIGCYPPRGDLAAILMETVAKEQELRDLREGPHRRQIAHLRLLAQNAVAAWKGKSPRVLAVFDNWRGRADKSSIWILHPGNSRIRVQEPKSAARGDWLPVHEDGTVGLSLDASSPAPFRLTQITIPVANRCTELIVETEVDYSGHIETVRATTTPLIRDADLKSGMITHLP